MAVRTAGALAASDQMDEAQVRRAWEGSRSRSCSCARRPRRGRPTWCSTSAPAP